MHLTELALPLLDLQNEPMQYRIQSPEGLRFGAESLSEISSAVKAGTVSLDWHAWHDGLPQWVTVRDLLSPAKKAGKGMELAGKTAGLLAKAGAGLAEFAATSYKKATLKSRFSSTLAAMLQDGELDDSELHVLRRMVEEAGEKWQNVVSDCRPIASEFIRHLLADAICDWDLTQQEERLIHSHIQRFGLQEMQEEVDAVISRVRKISSLRGNTLPKPLKLAPAWLVSGEAVYLHTKAEFIKDSGIVSSGELWVTSTRVEYVAPKAAASLRMKSMRMAEYDGAFLHLTASKGGTRVLRISEAGICAELILCLMRAGNRTANITLDGDTRQDRRLVSKETSNAVWIRDGGLCVECGSNDYIEFDHIIPVAKGGSNTVNNIQLLCRRCNGAKSDRI